jgi:hypothetical protein
VACLGGWYCRKGMISASSSEGVRGYATASVEFDGARAYGREMDAQAAGVLVTHACLHDPVAKPAQQPTLAYDREQLPVLRRHLGSGDAATVAAALVSCRRLLHDHKGAHKAYGAEGLLDAWAALAEAASSPPATRRLSLECLGLVLASPAARAATAERPLVAQALRASLSASDDACRLLAYAAVRNACEAHAGTAAILAGGFLDALVSRVLSEIPETRRAPALPQAVLGALSRLVAVGGRPAVDDALRCGAVPALLDALRVEDAPAGVLSSAAAALAELTLPSAGKAQVLASPGALRLLIVLTGHADAGVAGGAAGVLMHMVVEDDAKRGVLAEPSGLQALLNCAARVSGGGSGGGASARQVDAPAAAVVASLNACKAIATVAAYPAARQELRRLGAAAVLQRLTGGGGSSGGGSGPLAAALGRAAGIAVAALAWQA